MEKKTQKELILDYLRRHGSITPDEARLYCRKCERLAARISELRAKGYDIITDNVDAYGNTVNYAIYRLQPTDPAGEGLRPLSDTHPHPPAFMRGVAEGRGEQPPSLREGALLPSRPEVTPDG